MGRRALLGSLVVWVSGCALSGAETELLDPDGDGVDWPEDCDSDDAAVYPGATEICDGVDNDCDDTEEGEVWFQAAGGDPVELSALFAGGTSESPLRHVLSEDGTLSFCEGTWFVHLEVEADVRLVGFGASETALSGAGQGTVVRTRGAVEVEIEALAIEDGEGTEASKYDDGTTAGGGVYCGSEGAVTIRESVVRYNAADYGGGVYLEGCALEMEDATLSDNSAGRSAGGLYAVESVVTARRSALVENDAEERGGAVYLSTRTELSLSEGLVSDNLARQGGGGIYLSSGSTAALIDSTVGGNSGEEGGGIALVNQNHAELTRVLVEGNHASKEGGGLWLSEDSTLSAQECDFAENTPQDTYSPNEGARDWGAGASFECDGDGCD